MLDHLGLDDVTVVGISLGGGLAIQAAVEPRVRRAVAWDILSDFLEANLRQVNGAAEPFLRLLLRLRARRLVDAILRQAMARSYVARWGIPQGMHVLGVTTPYDYLRKLADLATDHASPRVTGDVLLLAGSRDHYVPLEQLYHQARALANARSVTARIFTAAEQAQSHVQVGNLGLAIDVILGWLEVLEAHHGDVDRRAE